jgi:3-oxoacyl-[acyl-carrier protein] reductase
LDISDPTAVQGMFQQLHTSGISVDIVVNNAAVLTSQYAMIMPAIAAQQMVNVNLLAPFYISREAAKSMRRKKWGRIINMGSMAERLEPVGDSVYAACKAGLITMGNVLAKEFATFNITCNTLGITAYQTEMLSQLPQDKVEEVLNGLTLPGYAEISDILNVIDFFSSDRSSNITAQTVYLGGVT